MLFSTFLFFLYSKRTESWPQNTCNGIKHYTQKTMNTSKVDFDFKVNDIF